MENYYNSSWKYRGTLKINHEKVEGKTDLLNFPAYLVLQNEDLGKRAQRSGADFLFTADDGLTKLCHEIRSWEPNTGHLVAYVKIPRLSPIQDTTVFVYYGNPDAEDQQDIEGVWAEYSMARHVGAGRTPTTERGGTVSHTQIVQLQRRLLEDLFGRRWFETASSRRDKHPAYKRWLFLNEMEISGGTIRATFESPEANEQAITLARMYGDGASLIQATQGPISQFTLGSLSNYGDAKVHARLRSVLPNPEQYQDVLAELSYAGWHLSESHKIQIYEDEGWPDFRIELPGLNFPVLADCKRVKKGATDETFRRVIKKANRQVKVPNIGCYGAVVIDASDLAVVY